MADYCITEAGFGADLGAEKFLDIKCRMAGLKPDAIVLVATVRALKYNGGIPKDELSKPDLEALKRGIVNLKKHIENLMSYGVPVVVTLNAFVTDSEEETAYVKKYCEDLGASFALSRVWEFGGKGGVELAQTVVDTIENKKSSFAPIYSLDLSIKEKIETIARKIYGADGVVFDPKALKSMEKLTALGFDKMPVCMAKTQYSLSDDPSLLGSPSGFDVHVRDMYVSAGAGFIVVLTGDIMTMPGLPKKPAAYSIDVNENGMITGLF
jgi:formate--tetrahydrofolate ligase